MISGTIHIAYAYKVGFQIKHYLKTDKIVKQTFSSSNRLPHAQKHKQ
jgi:hypothetical protein